MALINRPMYEHFGARHLGVKGPGALTQLEEGVMGVLPLDLSSDPMYWNIQGIRTFSITHSEAAGGAGTYAKMGLSLENAAEETLVRILGMWIENPSATSTIGIWRCARTSFSSDPGVYGYGTDTRIPEGQHSKAVLINSADAAAPGQILGDLEVGLNQFLPTQMPLIVSPEQCIYFLDNTANERFAATISWVEIPAYRAEL
jgi:hypothetical protein